MGKTSTAATLPAAPENGCQWQREWYNNRSWKMHSSVHLYFSLHCLDPLKQIRATPDHGEPQQMVGTSVQSPK